MKEDSKPRYKELKESANDVVKKSISMSKKTTSRLNQSNHVQNVKANAGPFFREVKSKSSKAVSGGIKSSRKLERAPTILRNIGSGSLNALEKFVGRIRIGTQYGKTSLDVLEELSKLKELGIISEEEYLRKKSEILDRI